MADEIQSSKAALEREQAMNRREREAAERLAEDERERAKGAATQALVVTQERVTQDEEISMLHDQVGPVLLFSNLNETLSGFFHPKKHVCHKKHE